MQGPAVLANEMNGYTAHSAQNVTNDSKKKNFFYMHVNREKEITA